MDRGMVKIVSFLYDAMLEMVQVLKGIIFPEG